MATPDQTAAFDADADTAQKAQNTRRATEADNLRARLRAIESDQVGKDEEVPTERPVVVDEQGNEIGVEEEEIVAPNTAEVDGSEFGFYAPKQTALLAFGLGTSNRRKGELVMSTMQRFIGFHLDEASYETFMERMSDPHDEWGDKEFGELINAIVESAKATAEAQAPNNGPAINR